jgi:hypothetical protein
MQVLQHLCTAWVGAWQTVTAMSLQSDDSTACAANTINTWFAIIYQRACCFCVKVDPFSNLQAYAPAHVSTAYCCVISARVALTYTYVADSVDGSIHACGPEGPDEQ